jgi:hypothetical protein
MAIRVSIIIPTYNRGQILADTIRMDAARSTWRTTVSRRRLFLRGVLGALRLLRTRDTPTRSSV